MRETFACLWLRLLSGGAACSRTPRGEAHGVKNAGTTSLLRGLWPMLALDEQTHTVRLTFRDAFTYQYNDGRHYCIRGTWEGQLLPE